MTMEVRTRIIPHPRAKTLYLTIPSAIAGDSAFPFKPSQEVNIRIDRKKLVIE